MQEVEVGSVDLDDGDPGSVFHVQGEQDQKAHLSRTDNCQQVPCS